MQQHLKFFAYVDDVTLSCLPDHFPLVWEAWQQALHNAGLPMEVSKCQTWIPSAMAVNPNLHAIVPQSLSGLPLLGTAACGEFEQLLGPFGLHLEPATKRLQASVTLADQLCDLADVQLDISSKNAVWILLSRLLSHKLDYDARVTSPSALEAHATALDQHVLRVV